jgi:signal transduction histidine kinase
MSVTLMAKTSSFETIKVCVSPNSMPIETIENKKHIGMSADFLHLIARDSGIKFELYPTLSWEESLNAAKNHKCDILSAADRNDELNKHFNFTESFMYFPIVIIAKEGIPFVSSLESIREKRIATIASAEYIELLKKRYPDMQLAEMTSTKEGLYAVLSGKVDYFLDITADLTYVSRKYSISGINIVGFTGDDFHYRVAVGKDKPALFQKIATSVLHISTEQRQYIFNKWIDTDIESVRDYSFIWKVLLASLFIFLFFFLWNRKLSKEISKRKNIEKQLFELNSSLEEKIQNQLISMREQDHMLAQQSRLAQMGELLSNIAHQWRQPLTQLNALFMQIEIKIKEKKLDASELQTMIEKNNIIVEYMSQTIEDFTHFFQVDRADKVWFDPLETCREAIGIIEGTLHSNKINLHKNYTSKTTKLYGHPRAFSHIVLVLLSNANDVIKKSSIKQAEIWIEIRSDEQYFYMTIEDNAGGIDAKIMPKIFDPYFTTKEEGSGIGLYMASTIIKRIFNGSIYVNNGALGAKFVIKIPIKT